METVMSCVFVVFESRQIQNFLQLKQGKKCLYIFIFGEKNYPKDCYFKEPTTLTRTTLPSEFYDPEDLKTSDAETETCISES